MQTAHSDSDQSWRDELISSITSYYEFLARIYLPSSEIKYPPPGGWPDITPEYLAFLGKDDAVVDIIKHLPLVRQCEAPEDEYQIYEKCVAIDYAGAPFRRHTAFARPNPESIDPMEGESLLPPHVFTLARPSTSPCGHYIFVDTQRRTITLCDFTLGWTATELSEMVDDDSKEKWRKYETYRVRDFFERLKEKFRTFDVIPISEKEVKMRSTIEDSEMAILTGIYREHGRLTDNYRRQECMEKIVEEWDILFEEGRVW